MKKKPCPYSQTTQIVVIDNSQVVCVENPAKSIEKKLLELINTFSKVRDLKAIFNGQSYFYMLAINIWKPILKKKYLQ